MGFRVFLLLLIVFNISYAKYQKDFDKLSNEQLSVLEYSYTYVTTKYQDSELGSILVSIAWKESNLGKWPINFSDGKYGSYGLYHILLEYQLVRAKVIDTKWNRSRIAEKLILDNDYSTETAIKIFLKYYNYYKNLPKEKRLLYTIASYNGGYKPNNRSFNYARDILERKKHIDNYVKTMNNIATKD